MVKLYSKIVAASVLFSAAVPANAMWRSFVSRIGRNVKRASLVGGSAFLGKCSSDIDATTPKNNRWTRLDSACQRGNLWLVKALHYFGADIHVSSANYYGYTPLHIAASSGQERVISYFLQEGVDVNSLSISKKTALHKACQNGHLCVAVKLLNEGAEVNLIDDNGKAPLNYACESGNVDLVKSLLAIGADSNVCVKPYKYKNPKIRRVLYFWEKFDIEDDSELLS